MTMRLERMRCGGFHIMAHPAATTLRALPVTPPHNGTRDQAGLPIPPARTAGMIAIPARDRQEECA